MHAHLFSIGHSRHPIGAFLSLLAQHGIEALVDVRSTPYSRFSPQFAIGALRSAVTGAGCDYVFLGKELGGRPEGAEFYDQEGRVLYGRRARSPELLAGIARLAELIERRRVAILCSEENPEHCHRRLLVGRILAARGVAIDHIRGDGRLEPETELAAGDRQRNLFASTEDDPSW
jgi:uncharacterized protein (DUF488 family)